MGTTGGPCGVTDVFVGGSSDDPPSGRVADAVKPPAGNGLSSKPRGGLGELIDCPHRFELVEVSPSNVPKGTLSEELKLTAGNRLGNEPPGDSNKAIGGPRGAVLIEGLPGDIPCEMAKPPAGNGPASGLCEVTGNPEKPFSADPPRPRAGEKGEIGSREGL